MSSVPKYQGYVIVIGAVLILLVLLSYEANRCNKFLGTVTGIKVVSSGGTTGKLYVETENNLYKQEGELVTDKAYKHESWVFLLGKYVLVIFSLVAGIWAMVHYNLGATDSKGYPI